MHPELNGGLEKKKCVCHLPNLTDATERIGGFWSFDWRFSLVSFGVVIQANWRYFISKIFDLFQTQRKKKERYIMLKPTVQILVKNQWSRLNYSLCNGFILKKSFSSTASLDFCPAFLDWIQKRRTREQVNTLFLLPILLPILLHVELASYIT